MDLRELVDKIFDEIRKYHLAKKVTVVVENDMGIAESFSREWKN